MFTISTDTSCDVFRPDLDGLNVKWIPLTFIIGEQSFFDDFDKDSRYKAFYEKIRGGAVPSTSQINVFLHEEFFDSILEGGATEIVHLSLSGGLSNTYINAQQAAIACMERHPGKKIFVVDTLGATQGHRALLDLAISLRDCDTSAKSAAAQLEERRDNLQHWIIVDDLMHLKRGGRVSGAAAYIGSLLNLKPILIINDEGKLCVVHKSKGTAKAMNYLIDMMKQHGDDIDNSTVYIATADATDKVEQMKKLIEENFKCKVVVGWIGPVIGAHTGAGTLGIVFKSKGRLCNKSNA